MEMIIVALVCFGLGIFYKSGDKRLDTDLIKHLKLGRRIVICIDDEATIMEYINNKIRITKAHMNFSMEKLNESESNDVAGGGSNQSVDSSASNL